MKAFLDTYKGSDDEAKRTKEIAARDEDYKELCRFASWLRQKRAYASAEKGVTYAYINIHGGIMYKSTSRSNYEIITEIDNLRSDLGQVLWDIYQAEME